MIYRNPEADIKAHYPNAARKAAIIALLLILFLAVSFVKIEVKPMKAPEYQATLELEDIPITKRKIEREKPKPKIATPIEVEEEEVEDTVTIAETELEEEEEYVPPPPPEEEILDFFAVEKQPEAVKEIKPKYPELARKAGQEGAVLVEVVVNEQGTVDTAYVVQARPKGIFEEAAINAAYKWKFTPAYQRDKPVKVRMRIPFRFSLRE